MTEIKQARTGLEDVEEALKDVIDPELGVNIVDLGLLYGLKYSDDDGALLIDMTLTTAACPLTDVIEEQVGKALDGDRGRLAAQLGVDAAVGSGADHRRRPRPDARPRLQHLITPKYDGGRSPSSEGDRPPSYVHRLLRNCPSGAPKRQLMEQPIGGMAWRRRTCRTG